MRDKLKSILKHYFPFFYAFVRSWYWKIRVLKEYLLGTKVQETYWAKRHLKKGNDWGNCKYFGEGNEWIKSYWDSQSHSHRSFLLEKIANFFPISSILEIGCNCGPNLYLVAQKFPNSEIKGIDINPMAVQKGNKWFAEEGISNVKLLVGKADDLHQFQDKSFDIVFTDALLIYIAPDKIKKVIQEMLRITYRVLILVEWHYKDQNKDSQGLGIYHFGCWKRNYVNLLKQVTSIKQIRLTKIPKELWSQKNWQNLGYIIEVIL